MIPAIGRAASVLTALAMAMLFARLAVDLVGRVP